MNWLAARTLATQYVAQLLLFSDTQVAVAVADTAPQTKEQSRFFHLLALNMPLPKYAE